MNSEPSARSLALKSQLQDFMDEHIYPAEAAFNEHMSTTDNVWAPPPLLTELKAKARAAGL
ncbi:MAG: hypothetical protein DRQ61_12730 [Gammaproteobacteria bacterium]|nr:MAG: hypothetical protein DRQ61_12730 [Gammaproteobacteria bacterium]